MSRLENIPLAIASSAGRSPKGNAAELINMYIHLEDGGSKTKAILLYTPGAEVISVFNYEILGFYYFLGVTYAVTKNKLYKVTEITGGGVEAVALGNISMQTDKVIFANNGTEMVFVGIDGYAYNPATDTLKNMNTETGWYDSETVTYMDGYFIFSRKDTGQFFITQLFSTILDPIDWATGEAAPDDTVAVIVANRQLWIIGERTSEVWYDSGDPLFPFTRVPGAVVDIGSISYKTVSKAQDIIMLVGDDLRVYRSNGYQLLRISTQAIENSLSKTDVTKISSFTFHERGRWFYAMTLDENKTYVYDMQTTLWHTRESDDIGRWLMKGVYNNYKDGVNYGYAGNNLYRISEDLYQEDGANVLREIISLPINQTVNRIRISELELDMEVDLNEEAIISLQLSSDAGKTWSNKSFASTGKHGHALTRVKWRRLGQHRNVMAKFSTSSPVPLKILSLNIRIS